MTQKPRRGTARVAPADPSEIEETNQKILDAVRRLDRLGKTFDDVIALFKQFASKDFNFDRWPADQVWPPQAFWTAIELMSLCTFEAVQSGRLAADPIILSWLALLYGDVINHRAEHLFGSVYDDWQRGKKSREKGAENYGAPATRYLRKTRVEALNVEILLDWVTHKRPLSSLTKIKRHQRIATEYQKRYQKAISLKIVERDLPYPKPRK